MAAHQAGDLKKAVRLYAAIAPKDPAFAAAARYHGAALLQLGEFRKAAHKLTQATQAAPGEAEPFVHLAMARQALGEMKQAQAATDRALTLNPAGPDALTLAAELAIAREDFDDAVALYARLVAAAPGDPDALQKYAFALDRTGARRDAMSALRQALALAPDHVESLTNLSALLLAADQQEHADEALDLAARAVAVAPEENATLMNYGVCLNGLHRYSEAIEVFNRLPEAALADGLALTNKATALWALGCNQEAIAACRDAIGRAGPNPAFLWRLSLYLAFEGEEAEAARLAAAGFDCGERGEDRRGDGVSWRGPKDRAASVLLWREQGIGDQIRFAAWVTPEWGARKAVTLECDARLAPLFQRSFPFLTVTGERQQCDDFEAQAPIGDLPQLTGEWAPRRTAYLIPDPGRVAEMLGWLGTVCGEGRRVIGLVWTSGLVTLARRWRLTKPAQWRPVIEAHRDAFWVNLCYHDVSADVAEFKALYGVDLVQPPGLDMRDDLEGVAALTACLDAAVGITVSALELAGALGVPSLHLGPEYAPDRPHPVYENAEMLFRRSGETDWSAVMARATERILVHRS